LGPQEFEDEEFEDTHQNLVRALNPLICGELRGAAPWAFVYGHTRFATCRSEATHGIDFERPFLVPWGPPGPRPDCLAGGYWISGAEAEVRSNKKVESSGKRAGGAGPGPNRGAVGAVFSSASGLTRSSFGVCPNLCSNVGLGASAAAARESPVRGVCAAVGRRRFRACPNFRGLRVQIRGWPVRASHVDRSKRLVSAESGGEVGTYPPRARLSADPPTEEVCGFVRLRLLGRGHASRSSVRAVLRLTSHGSCRVCRGTRPTRGGASAKFVWDREPSPHACNTGGGWQRDGTFRA